MQELIQNIQAILCKPQLSALATVTPDGKPWVRYVMTVGNADMVIRCATFTDARKVEQIRLNPEVHLTCGVTDPMTMSPYLQIQGRARLTTDEAERHAFWNPMLARVFATPDNPKYGILVIEAYRIEYCVPPAHTPEVWTREH
ncbi:MAG: hypothetical protein D6820_14510 [Lentisphaerae bacterium]|nr:MAG: hypothetical protein D6820_14510 [Lentisphaerota bacterium]